MSTFEFDDSTASDHGDPSIKVETADVGPRPTRAKAAHASSAAPAAPTPLGNQIYTRMARQGVNAAEVVNAAMQKRLLGATTPRRIEVIAPNGPSTSGGKKARQSITLTPAEGSKASVVIGFLDVAAKSFELRAYQVIAQQYRQRFGHAFDGTPEEYAGVARELTKVLEKLGFKPADPNGERDEDDSEEAGGASTGQKLIFLGIGVVVTIVGTLWWLK